MRASWLHNNNNQDLIVFCNGWGMDGNPFQNLASNGYDVYMLYDYRDLAGTADLPDLLRRYQRRLLVAWSMGVWVGQILFGAGQHRFHRTVAINGTLCPIDDQLGIPLQILAATLAGYDEKSRLKFYKRMCRDQKNLGSFLDMQPERSVEEQKDELAALKEMVTCLPVEDSLYREIIVSDKDYVMPSASQIRFWQGSHVVVKAGYHFLFHRWTSWDQLLDCIACSPAANQ